MDPAPSVHGKDGSKRRVQPQGPRGSIGVVGTPVVARRGVTGTAETDGVAAARGRIPVFAPSSARARTRLAVAGWVENRLSAPRPARGLMMNIWPEAGLRSAVGLWIRFA